MIEPVPSITTPRAGDERGVELLAGVELAQRHLRGGGVRRNQRASSRDQRLSRPRSRAQARARGGRARRGATGPGSSRPLYTWSVRTTSRLPTSVEIGPAYSAAPVSMRMPNSVGVDPVHRALDAVEAQERRLGFGRLRRAALRARSSAMVIALRWHRRRVRWSGRPSRRRRSRALPSSPLRRRLVSSMRSSHFSDL